MLKILCFIAALISIQHGLVFVFLVLAWVIFCEDFK
jgi:hypothetical protein